MSLRGSSNARTNIIDRQSQYVDNVPNQLCEFIEIENNRFSEICKLYLQGLSIDDIAYLEPQDLINIVPESQYRHKLLMTILVRRYIYKSRCVECTDKGKMYCECVNEKEKNNGDT